MRSFNVLLTLAALASTALAIASPTRTSAKRFSIDGLEGMSPSRRHTPYIGDVTVKRDAATNAQRLARGLPPLPPKRRSGRAALARRSAGVPVSYTGTIQVTNAGTGAVVGYVYQASGSTNHFGVTTDMSSALSFMLSVDSTVVSSSGINIAATTSTYATTWPYMGGIVGVINTNANLASGSPNFAYVQGTSLTPDDSPAASVSNSYPTIEKSESAIWNYDASTGAISAQWINIDGSAPATAIVYVAGSNALVLAGDASVFASSFPGSYAVTFTFVSST
ncbi:hypothetical protein FB451DRAFT_1215152 [Mycena latifolia]|nr:hypothetical protein FB451DRAFT_1215152 [Mycena latifolia]